MSLYQTKIAELSYYADGKNTVVIKEKNCSKKEKTGQKIFLSRIRSHRQYHEVFSCNMLLLIHFAFKLADLLMEVSYQVC